MTLAVDARWMVGQYRGMGRFAHALLKPVRHDVKAFLPSGYSPTSEYQTVCHGHGFFPYWEQIELPRLCKQWGIKDLICPYNTAPLKLPASTTLTLVVHDLIYMEPWRQLPASISAYQTLGRLYRRIIVPEIIKRAGRVVTVSNYTRDQISSRFSIPKENIVVIPNSLSDDWFVDEPMSLAARDPYLLAVAGEAPSKNLPALIRAFALFRAECPTGATLPALRVVGIKRDHQKYFQDLAIRAGVGQWIGFESFLTEIELKRLYRHATLFVMPSLFEGFGIPVLEAMASGTPVICSNTTSLPEVVGDAGWLFDPRNINDIAEKLLWAWIDHTGRVKRAILGLTHAQRYRSSTVATSIAAFWNNL